MGLFGGGGSKSSSFSTTTVTTTDNSKTSSGTIGDLSKNNLIAGGNATMYGYSADDTDKILNTTLDYVNKAVEGIKDVTGKAINQVQSAYSGANDSILQSANENKAILKSLQPFALYGAIAAIFYFVFKK